MWIENDKKPNTVISISTAVGLMRQHFSRLQFAYQFPS